jgi:hypothetical protein
MTFNQLRAIYLARQVAKGRANAVLSIRTSLAHFGHDTTDLGDEQIEQCVVSIGKALASTGVSAREASDALKRLMQACSAAE